jgi:hypothetical protein
MGLGLAVAPDADADTGQPVSGAVNGAVADD